MSVWDNQIWIQVLTVWANFSCQLDTAQSQQRESRLGYFPGQIGLSPCLQEIVLTDDWCERSQPTVGSNIPPSRTLGSVKKLAEAMGKPESRQGGSYPSWFLLRLPPVIDCCLETKTEHFPPRNYCWSELFITATTKLEHHPGVGQLVLLPPRSFAPGQTAFTLSFRTLVFRLPHFIQVWASQLTDQRISFIICNVELIMKTMTVHPAT